MQHIDSRDPRPVYDAVLFEQRIKFQYPPTSLLALEALRRVDAPRLSSLLNVVSWITVAMTAIATGLLLRAGSGGRRGTRLFLLGVAATITFYPVVKAYTLGQIQAWITVLLALMLLAWVEGRRAMAGVLLGLVCLVKPHFAVVGVWGLLRRESRFAAAAAVTAGAGLALSLHRHGLANHLNYLDALSFLGRRGESFYPNQSMNGLLHRLLFTGNNVQLLGTVRTLRPRSWSRARCSARSPWWRSRCSGPSRRHRGGPIDLATVLLAGVMASPIAWEHHYAVLAPIDALLAPQVLRTGDRRTVALLGLSYLLSANFLAVAQRLAETAWNPLQSYLYFGALIAFGILLAMRRGDTAPPAPGEGLAA